VSAVEAAPPGFHRCYGFDALAGKRARRSTGSGKMTVELLGERED
jgi:hypothetical protein